MKRLWRAIEFLAWGVFFACALFVLALRFWILPDIESYRERIVAAVSKSVGLPVRIGSIEAGWLGLRPQLSLSDVRVIDQAGREALVLPAIENVISWRSFLRGELRLHSLAIDGPRLSVRRDADGVLYVAGLRLGGGGGESRMSDWLLAQDEIVVRNAEIEWRDEKRAAPPLTLSALNLRVRNSGDRHLVGLSARPPAALGSTLEVRAQLTGRALTHADPWNGRAYVELGYTDLAGWRAWLDYPVDVSSGQGALRVWSTFENGELTQATADVALAGLNARLARDLPPVELAALTGRIRATLAGGGYEIAGRQLALVSKHGPSIEPTDFDLAWQPAAAGAPEHGAFSAKRLDLEPLARLVETLPFPAGLRQLLAETGPRGRVADAAFEWTGNVAEPATFKGKGRFEALALKPRRDLPGFAGLSGSFEATEKRGSVQLASRNAQIDLPRLLSDPRVQLDSLDGQVDFERAPAGTKPAPLTLRIASLSFANPHLEGKASGTYRWPGEGRGSIDLDAALRRAEGSQVARYLPVRELIGQPLHDYLAAAIVEGKASDVRFKLKGDLRDFPFVDPAKGEFRVSARVEKGVLEYVPGWPRITDIDAELLFEREKMEIVGRSATVLGAKLANVHVGIANLAARPALISVSGQADGPTQEFLRFVEGSPVRRMIGGFSDGMKAEGRGKLRLKLEIPLDDPTHTRVAGDYELAANTVNVRAGVPPIERASGHVAFTESSVRFQDVKARFLGGPVSIGGGSKAGAGVEVVAKGDATVAATQPLFDHPWRRYLAGAAPYTATVSLQEGRTRVSFESSLRGVTSALPPPFAKTAAEALALRVDVFPTEGGARDRISIALGRIAAVELLRRRQGEAMTVQRASLRLSPAPDEAVRLPERPGTLVYGSLGGLDLDRWLALAQADAPKGAAEPARAPGEPQGAADGPTAFDVSFGTLDVFGKRLHAAQLRGGADLQGWSASVEAEELAGDLSYRGEKGGQLVARFKHLSIPADYPGAKAADGGGEGAKQLPSVDVVAERFTFRDKQLGRIAVLAQRADRDWRIDKLELLNTEASVSGKGLWRPAEGRGGAAETSLDLNLESSDSGKFLDRLGYPGLVRGAKARMQANLTWAGDPTAIDYPSLTGVVQLQADDGQFLEIDPGIGKLVSLMSLQALPKRLTLDFRDVFSKGFQFDRIAASASVSRGIMAIRDFKMTGSAADVGMEGSVDLARETQNLHVRVVPQLGDTASTAIVLLNPLLFFPAAIAQRILKDPLGHIFAFNYTITGGWSDPKVAKGRIEAKEVAHEPGEAPAKQ